MFSEEQIDLLTRLFQSRYGIVCAVIKRYAPKDDTVEDIVQQVYLDFIDGAFRKKWDLSTDIGPLLCRIAKRKVQLLWRSESRRNPDSIESVLERLSHDCDRDDEREYERIEEEVRAMRHCLEKLPRRGRNLVRQHYFDGIPIKDIARREGKKSGNIRNFLFRIRAKLRECIERQSHENRDEPRRPNG